MMPAMARADHERAAQALDRLSLCFSANAPGVVVHGGQPDFSRDLSRFYPANESDAAEKLVQLKSRLNASNNEDFWATATKGIADIVDAQYAFISKRVLVNDQDVAVEMPPTGEKGSCLMAMAFYWNDRKGGEGVAPNVNYEAFAAPCAYMKHDKVFIIPSNCATFAPHEQNPNAENLVDPIASYIAVPLFSEGKCFAHFGVSWSEEGERDRKLGWGFLELLLHSLEDIVLQRVLQGSGLSRKIKSESSNLRPVVPHQAVAPSQSLKPYARSLSHELRTPMQGVVGMLDVMHASVQEAMEGVHDQHLRDVFAALRDNIETVQDSSRRAVEAADNVVHAYDMNMDVPPIASGVDKEAMLESGSALDAPEQPEVIITSAHLHKGLNQGRKRRRESIRDVEHKRRKSLPDDTEMSPDMPESIRRTSKHTSPLQGQETYEEEYGQGSHPILESPPCISEQGVVPGLRHANLREVLQYVVNDALRVGGRPDSAIAEPTEDGETIEVRVTHPTGEEKVKIIEWAVDPGVPETILIDEKDFAKMISCVFLNAVKFTDEGRITLKVRLTPSSRYIVVSCTDTGPGMPEDFLPLLFKPFSREDDSLTRQNEGLGLGLLVAKGLARKLRGDLICVRAETKGVNHGCAFEMRVPVTSGDELSRAGSPFNSPTPSRRSRPLSVDSEGVTPEMPGSNALRTTNSPQLSHSTAPTSVPTSISSPRPSLYPSPSLYLPHPSSVHHPQVATLEPAPAARQTQKENTTPFLHVSAAYNTGAVGEDHAAQHASTRARPSKNVRSGPTFDRDLAKKYPLNILVAEDNKINRRLLVNMLGKLGYSGVHEAYDGADAVRQMEELVAGKGTPRTHGVSSKYENGRASVDLVLMDLWMPLMDGYEATKRILAMADNIASSTHHPWTPPAILAVTADVTDGALERAIQAGMKGFMTKPYQLKDLEKLIVDFATGAS